MSAPKTCALVAGSLTLCALTAFAVRSWSDEATEPSLHALPVNSEVLLKTFSDADRAMHPDLESSTGWRTVPLQSRAQLSRSESSSELWPEKALMKEPLLCREIGVGCSIVEYFDNETFVNFPFLKKDSSNSEGVVPSESHQFFLSHYLDRAAPADARCLVGAHVRSKVSSFVTGLPPGPRPIYGNCRKAAIPELSTPEQIRVNAAQAIQAARDSIIANGRVSPQAEREVLRNPLAFRDLPALYRDSISTSAQESVEILVNKALWLTIEALTNSAYSTLPTFPYLDGNSVTPDKLLTADRAVEIIRSMRGDLPLIALNDGRRRELSESCMDFPKSADDLHKPCRGFLRHNGNGGWKTLAAYSPNQNVIYVDYTTDFYEAVYSLQHELWHAVSENTAQSELYRRRVEALAQLPVDENSTVTLKQTIFYLTIQNELNAISESNLLYRFAGHLTHQWGGLSPSAKGWYDHEFGDPEIEKLYIPFSRRLDWIDLSKDSEASRLRGEEGTWMTYLAELTVVGCLIPPLFFDNKIKKAESEDRARLEKLGEIRIDVDQARQAFSDRFMKEDIPPSVLEFFGEKYQLTLPDFHDFEQPKGLAKMEFVPPTPAHLTCAQADRIAALMPDEWEHGIPLYFEAANPDGTPCAQGPGHIPGVGGGTHGDISALPCVSGEK